MLRAPVATSAILAVALVLAAAAMPAHAASGPGFTCTPGPADCGGWFTGDVTLRWSWDPSATATSGCDTRSFSVDTRATDVTCSSSFGSSGSATTTATIRLDKTPPTVDAAVPDRPPDSNAWYTRPVTFSFAGSDATSGIEACPPITYGGPDGAAASVAGTCRDRAGNVASRTFPLKYKATPPVLSSVGATAGDGTARLAWFASADTQQVRVVRTGPGAAGVKTVYWGLANSYLDRGLENGVTYSYELTAFDEAGNISSAHTSAVPRTDRVALGARARAVSRTPLLEWPRRARASYYNLQIYRGGDELLSAWSNHARLQVRRNWRFRERNRHLAPGTYRWYVWPGYGSRSKNRYGPLLGRGSFTVVG